MHFKSYNTQFNSACKNFQSIIKLDLKAVSSLFFWKKYAEISIFFDGWLLRKGGKGSEKLPVLCFGNSLTAQLQARQSQYAASLFNAWQSMTIWEMEDVKKR